MVTSAASIRLLSGLNVDVAGHVVAAFPRADQIWVLVLMKQDWLHFTHGLRVIYPPPQKYTS